MVKSQPHYDYDVTENGKVFSVSSDWRGYGKREMKQTLNSSGYPSVRITINGKRTRIPVHKLVAQKFLEPKPSDKHEIRHLDGNKNNNHHTNLAWGTPKDNALDRRNHGRTSKGILHSNAIKEGVRNGKN